MLTRSLGTAVVSLILLSGCDKAETKVANPPPPPVNVILPVAKEVQEFDEFTGRAAAVESVEIRARVTGYIASIDFKDGDEVKKGQLLFQIDPRPYQTALDAANAGLASAVAEQSYAQTDVKRIEPAAQAGAASVQELEKAKDTLARAEAKVSAAKADIERAKLDLDFASVKSPIDGRVSKSSLTTGNLVAGDTLLTTVVSVDPMYVNFDVDERRMLFYKEEARKRGQEKLTRLREANLPLFVGLANEKDFPHQGIIEFADNQVDPLTGTIRVRGELANQNRLLVPGQFVRVQLRRGDPKEALLIPDRAVSRDQDRKFVLVVDDKNVVQYRSVETGGLFGEDRAILKGIAATDKIVVDGIQRARPGAPVTPTLITGQPGGSPAGAPATQPAK